MRDMPSARHAKPARVVEDDEVDPARLGTLGADARPRAAADDRLARRDLRSQALLTFGACKKVCWLLRTFRVSRDANAGAAGWKDPSIRVAANRMAMIL